MSWLARLFRRGARGPGGVDGALRAALCAVLERDWDEAERLLSGAAQLDPDGVVAYLSLARLLRQRGEIGRAIRIHQNLLLRTDLEPAESLAALSGLAADFRQGGFVRRAIASYEEVLAREPRHREALSALVRLHADVRDHARAIQMARRLAKVEGRSSRPDEAQLLVEMARTALAEGRSDDARRALKRALRRDRSCVPAWLALGVHESECGRKKAALDAWRRVPALDRSRGPLVYPRLDAAYAALERGDDYERYLRELLDERPEDAGARLALARALAARGGVDDAVAELRRLLEREPEDLEARGMLGRILLAEHRDQEATKEYAELLDVLDRQDLLRPRETLD